MKNLRIGFAPVLAHEIAHSLQYENDNTIFHSGNKADVANQLQKKYHLTRLSSDYFNYVSCEIELESHAAQLAMEILLTDPNLSKAIFI